MATGKSILNALRQELNLSDYRKKHWEGSFDEYLDIVREHPEVTRTAYQRLYDMIISHSTEEVYENKEKITRFKFFTEFAAQHGDAIYGLDRPLMHLANCFKSAAKGYGTERRVLLLHGPVGSSKSTIARLLKKGLEQYSKSDEGMLFSFSWKGEGGAWHKCPMHEDPLRLVPFDLRPTLLARLNEGREREEEQVRVAGDMCPFCRQMFNERLAKYDGDWHRMLDEIKVYRLILSEQDRIGIGTFQPKDEKNQDSTELTGDINYRKIAEFGSDSDPRAFNFDGELNIANRGLVEFIEVLKLDVAFLYDLLGASQEHVIKPKKFAQTSIDEVIIGHTNEPEYRKLQNNELMEAFRDRTLKIDVPYNSRLDDEIKIYFKDFGPDKVRGIHIAPHTIEVAAMWAVREEYEDILKGEVQRAISADEDAIKRLAINYIENVKAYTQKQRVRNKYTGRDEEPDERLMRSIEEKIDIPDSRKDDFRQEIMNYIGALALDGKKFEYNTNARLLKALELKLFEDQRDTIKLKNLVSSVVDDETQQKIDVVKQRLIKYFGYNETSATDVLNYVASIFARGDSKQEE